MLFLAQYIFLAPLICFAALALFHERVPALRDKIATGVMGSCLLASLIIFFAALGADDHAFFIHWTFDWLPVSSSKAIQGGILVDGLTAMMLVVVTLVSFLVHLFSTKYMEGDVRYGRYFVCLQLFTMSMLGIVLADNLLFLFIFWELVGLSSYTLIGHWYEKKTASDAAIKAFITTRVGDVGMLLGLLICYWKVGSLQYVDLFAAVELNLFDVGRESVLGANWLTLAGLGLFFGAMGKSAQWPLHVWLPDAMEGPTPVSALIHAATMVAAGVYLVGRLFPLFTPEAFIFIAYIGAITALFAATIATVQDDIKKVLAYSTLSQLGYMVLALGVGGYVAGLYHLTTHAFFKAGLFLGSGAVIHAMHHEQSMSRYGGLRKKLPVTHWTYLVCVLAIVGCPFFAGFYSKDEILYAASNFSLSANGHWFLIFSGFFTAVLTSYYMFRQYFLTFHGKPRDQHAYDHAHEGPMAMNIPLITLAALAVLAGLPFVGAFPNLMPEYEGEGIIQQYASYHGYEGETTLGTIAAHSIAMGAVNAPGGVVEAIEGEEHVAPHGEEAAARGADHGEGLYLSHGMVGLIATGLFVVGLLIAAALYLERKDGKTLVSPAKVTIGPLHTLLWNKYYFDEAYGLLFLASTHAVTRAMAWFDKYVIDGIVNGVGFVGKWTSVLTGFGIDNWGVDGLVNGVAFGTARIGNALSFTQTGKVRQYLLFIALGVIGLTAILTLITSVV